jgi:hypothetical protein
LWRTTDSPPLTAPPIDFFHGTFEGLGHQISQLTLNPKNKWQHIGVFGTSDGTIRDIRLAQIIITAASKSEVGALVGNNAGTLIGDIADITVTADGTTFVGGLAGQSSGSIVRCSSRGVVMSDVTVFGGPYAGGLVGYSQGTIDSSDSSASVTGRQNFMGGSAGGSSGFITSSHASGQSGDSSAAIAGGLAAFAGGSISNSYATGDAFGQYGAAGWSKQTQERSAIPLRRAPPTQHRIRMAQVPGRAASLATMGVTSKMCMPWAMPEQRKVRPAASLVIT